MYFVIRFLSSLREADGAKLPLKPEISGQQISRLQKVLHHPILQECRPAKAFPTLAGTPPDPADIKMAARQ